MQDCLRSRLATDSERYIHVRNDNQAAMKTISVFKIQIETRYFLDLHETFVVSSFRRNLIFNCFLFGQINILFLNSNLVGTGILIEILYKLDTQLSNGNRILHTSNYGTKRRLIDESSTMLWHQRLGHISKQSMQRLVSYGILDSLDMFNFEICIECIKVNK